MTDLAEKLSILADAAKYDASCASSAAPKRNSRTTGGLGSSGGAGICHSYTPDGRCVSLLKILLTNYCSFDCAYCVNRVSSNVRRARFTVDEVINLTLDFYRRNYIEGLFLSSGIIRSPNYTMEQLALVAQQLRTKHKFRGYIHLKTIPEADPILVEMAGRYADRLSINVELPTPQSLGRLAPEKSLGSIRTSMARLKTTIEEAKQERRENKRAPVFSPAGQSTQIIVGADASSDAEILGTSSSLYASYKLKRIYYSAFSPIPDASQVLPLKSPPLQREHRLYQADWLLRYYGFTLSEITSGMNDNMLDLQLDPKTAWALLNRQAFPVDLNRDDKERLMRVPGLGAKVADRIIATRRHRSMRLDDVRRLVASLKKVLPWITVVDWHPGRMLDGERLRESLICQPRQLSLFAA